MSPNAILAGSVLGHVAGLGVRDWVVCAGARNAPLVASLLARAETGGLRVRHHFDERAAAFFALGLAKRTGAPAAVLTTSGTAAAELLPAAVEAHYAGVPLVLVTADRPAAYRGSGAPQAIEQAGLLGPYALALDVPQPGGLADLSQWQGDAPLHLNVAFEEPRAEDRNEEWEIEDLRFEISNFESGSAEEDGELLEFCREREGLLVLLGELPEDWRGPVEHFVAALGCPVWAEAASGLRESAALAGRLLRGEPPLPARVLRIGGVPSLRLWRDLEADDSLPVLSVCRRPFPGLARPSRLIVTRRFPDLPPSEGAQQGRVADSTLSGGTQPSLVADPTLLSREAEARWRSSPGAEPAMLRELSRRIPSGALVYLGNSLPIREWNLAAVDDPPHPRCFASRGANGIDGQVATFLGLSEGEGESWGIFGDLTALYDLNAPALLPQLSRGRRRIVVIHNGGGRIFSRLPAMAGLPEPEKRVTENRHEVGFGPWAAMWGIEHRLWRAGEPFPDVSEVETLLLEIRPDEEETEAFWAARGK